MQKIKHYFLIALRNFRRNTLHTIINTVGLSIGIAACLFIFLIVNHEMGFDTFHSDSDRIYRIYSRFSGVFDGVNRGVATGLAGFTEEELTDFEEVAPVFTASMPVAVVEKDSRLTDRESQRDVAIVSPEYFKVFQNYEWLSGSPEEALSKPSQVVLTDEKAKLYFGVDNPLETLGRELRYRDSLALTVAGIIKKPSRLTDLYFNDFISNATIRNTFLKNNYRPDDWNSTQDHDSTNHQ
jgi:putative ABC transport system permease protein